MSPIPEKRPYATVPAPDRVFRVCFGTDPLALRPWNTVSENAPLAGRWDDSYKEFRVLYTSSTPEGALRETLQRFVPSREVLDRLKLIEVEEDEDPFDGINVVPISWLETRRLGELAVEEACVLVDPLHVTSLDAYFHQFEQHVTVGELLAPDTSLSRQMSRRLYNHADGFAGIYAISKLGHNLANYNFFESEPHSGNLRARLRRVAVAELTPNLSALFDVVNQLGLVFEGIYVEDIGWVQITPALFTQPNDPT